MSGGEWRRSKKCGETERAAPERGADRADQGRSARGGLDEDFGGRAAPERGADRADQGRSARDGLGEGFGGRARPRRSRSRPRWSPAVQIEAEAEQIKAERVTASLGEPILVRDDHRRSLVIEVGTGESWRCRNPRQRTRKP